MESFRLVAASNCTVGMEVSASDMYVGRVRVRNDVGMCGRGVEECCARGG